MESLIGIFTLTNSCHNIKCGHLKDASNALQCSAKQWLLSRYDSFTVKCWRFRSFFEFVNTCPCKILTVASIPIVCITFSENLTQFILIINPTIETFCCFPNAEVTEILLKSLVLSTGLAQRNI